MRRTKIQSFLSAQPIEKKAAMRLAAQDVIGCYTALALQDMHLLGDLLKGEQPRQWHHYPEEDVIDRTLGYQYFYHSHSPEDRKSKEHGHFHLFARMDGGVHDVDENIERSFLQRINDAPAAAKTASLLCISMDARGVPTALFTTNRWVTGDHLFSAETTLRLIGTFAIKASGPTLVNKWLAAMLRLFQPQIEALLADRDRVLYRRAQERQGPGLLDDEGLEVLSHMPINIDKQVALVTAL